ncbi:DUF4352 domain-containing protein [Rhodococcus tukisamuensis]|uniref:DUF4352 domain-containing protein n=1 Tax=Rhodococcus tukisamuensis TaxID=168276 RepID=A0A1G6MLQ2_9NOCA|nr:DUF4352 domain-containing protein [Rhodococcus tukisamuensis]SDC56401.1 protein of unknown function [Rhodococcus tukisamuensis]
MTDPNQPYPGQPYPQQPPAKKKRKIWPWIVIGIPVLLFGGCTVAMVSAVGGDEKATVSSGSSGGAPAANSGPDFPGKLAKDTSAPAGDTITRDNLAYTVTPLEQGSSSIGDYVCSDVTIKNVGDKQNDFNGYMDWSLQDANGAIRNATYAPNHEMLQSGQLAPGGQATGSICFDARQGAAPGTYIVLFKDTFSLSSDRIAWVNTL